MSDTIIIDSPRQLPLGEAEMLSGHLRTRAEKNFVLFLPVKNRVLAENLDINYPFNIKVGDSTPIGLFAKQVYSREERGIPLEALINQSRSALLTRAIFSDVHGNLYRDIDIKGIGYLVGEPKDPLSDIGVSKPGKGQKIENAGLLNRDEAFTDFEVSEELAKAGIRAVRTIAIVQLDELIVNGEKISIEEAKRKRIIDKKIRPVIQVRAFGTRARIGDIYTEQGHFLLADAKKLVAQELGKESLTDLEYCDWFAQTLGENIALLHNKGLVHGVLHNGNITLDCRLVDFVSVRDAKKWALPGRDMLLPSRALAAFSRVMSPFVRGIDLDHRLQELLQSSYEKHRIKLKNA